MKKQIMKIKAWLFNKNISTPKTLDEKIDYLKTLDIKPYDFINITERLDLYHKDIIYHLEFMKHINTCDIENEYLKGVNLNPVIGARVSFSKWCSDQNRFLPEPEKTIKEWLEEASEFNRKISLGNSAVGSGKLYSNCNKLKPYLKETEILVNKILEYSKSG